ncbi:reverse transcriptase domain-containing protein [Tanacetum coccineum]|uniref:Reverse transcriptase domain-containing protein n=1 Tax=Tanacetum coccineum TaxID=301880 RepID=A0ABQ4WUM0_9ASTR
MTPWQSLASSFVQGTKQEIKGGDDMSWTLLKFQWPRLLFGATHTTNTPARALTKKAQVLEPSLLSINRASHIRNSRNKPVVAKVSSSSSTPGISPDVAELKDMVKALLLDKKIQSQAPATIKAVKECCVTCGGAHSYRNCPATDGNVYRDNIQEYVSQAAAANFNQGNTGYRAPIANQIRPPSFPPVNSNTASSLGLWTLPILQNTNPKEDLKGITTRSGVAYQGPTIPTTSSSPPKVVECETEVTNDTVPPTNNGSDKDVNLRLSQLKLKILSPLLLPFFIDVGDRSGNPTPYYDADSVLTSISDSQHPFRDYKKNKSSIDEPPEVELKDLPPYLEYAFLEGDDKLPVIIAKEAKDKSHFMVKEGIVLVHKISKNEIEVDKAKVDVIAKLPHPTTVKGVRSFLGHAAFETLKKKLTEAPILIAPDWDLPFELMCDASDFAIGAV